MNRTMFFLATAFAATCIISSPAAKADEFGDNTPYYEDDAWYDISEWFDGNDYNPTDEAIGRWDDERFDFADAATSTDQDNDWNYGDYGYANSTANDNRWFYDYYDDGYGRWNNDDNNNDWSRYSAYFDNNDDGLYDGYVSYGDWDGDGLYEDYNYYWFDSNKDSNKQGKSQASDARKDMKARPEQIAGTIERTKMADVRGKMHLIAHVKTTDGKTVAVDLGVNKKDSQKAFEGQKLSAMGHRIKVGETTLVVATRAQVGDRDLNIDRSGRKYQGKVASTRKVDIRGDEHLLAKMTTSDGKSMMVDLGQSSTVANKVKEGTELTVQGVPVKVKDRVVLIAQQVTRDGQKMEIDRERDRTAKSRSTSTSN